MLTGKLPFEGQTPWEWATQHMTVEPRPMSTVAPKVDIPVPMQEAIFTALSKDKEDRQASAEIFLEALRRETVVQPASAVTVAGGGGTAMMDAGPGSAVGSGTALMDVPGSVSGPARTQAMAPGEVPAGGGVVRVPAGPIVVPPRRSKKKGVVMVLGGAAFLLLLAGGIVLARSLQTGTPQANDADLREPERSRGDTESSECRRRRASQQRSSDGGG